MTDFRRAIADELDRRGWSKYRLSKESGVNKTSVSEYLRGRREIESAALEQICGALDLRLGRHQG